MEITGAFNRRIAVILWLFYCMGSFVLAQDANSPADRRVTDPKSVKSEANTTAWPIAIDDLFYSRRVTSAAWSPNERQIAFSTNFTGRMNLWLVNSDGGWPLQLTVSDDRQLGAVWSPDGKWIVYQQDYGGSEYWDSVRRPQPGRQPAVNLTNTPDVFRDEPQFSPDGKAIAFGYKPKTSQRPTSHCSTGARIRSRILRTSPARIICGNWTVGHGTVSTLSPPA